VLLLIAAGKTTREIAAELVLSVRTIERHISEAYVRLGVRNRAEATAVVLLTRA
jgi:DNA-binding NarL/FixJ family response regulator